MSRFVRASAIVLAIALATTSITLAGCSRQARQPIDNSGGTPDVGNPVAGTPANGTKVSDKITTYSDGRLTAGPFPFVQGGSMNGFFFLWNGSNGLTVDIGGKLQGLVDIAAPAYYPAPSFENGYAASPDNTKVAYNRSGRLLVADLKSGGEKTWSLSKSGTDNKEFFCDVLMWSPNGRYLLAGVYIFPSQDVIGKLFVVDLQADKLTVIPGFKANQWFNQPTWSKDGNQVVLREYLEAYSESSYGQWILVDLPKAESKVVVPPAASTIEYAFSWLSDGGIEATPLNVGPDGVRAVGYDPTSRSFDFDIMQGYDVPMPFVAGELDFLGPDDQVQARIDLRPALEKAGLPMVGLNALTYTKTWSLDGEDVLLQGLARDSKDKLYTFNGIAHYADKTVAFLPVETPGSAPQSMQSQKLVWNGPLALILTDDNRTLQVLDARTMKTTKVGENPEGIHFYMWAGGKVVYLTTHEATAVGSDGSGRKVLLTADDGDVFIIPTIPSPDGRYLALTRNRPVDTTFKIEVLDLQVIR